MHTREWRFSHLTLTGLGFMLQVSQLWSSLSCRSFTKNWCLFWGSTFGGEIMFLVLTCMTSEMRLSRFGVFVLCDVFWVLINSLCWFFGRGMEVRGKTECLVAPPPHEKQMGPLLEHRYSWCWIRERAGPATFLLVSYVALTWRAGCEQIWYVSFTEGSVPHKSNCLA